MNALAVLRLMTSSNLRNLGLVTRPDADFRMGRVLRRVSSSSLGSTRDNLGVRRGEPWFVKEPRMTRSVKDLTLTACAIGLGVALLASHGHAQTNRYDA